MGGDKEEREPPSNRETCFHEAFHLEMIKRGHLLAKRMNRQRRFLWLEVTPPGVGVSGMAAISRGGGDQATDATHHLLHVGRRGVDPAAQPVVLGEDPVVLQWEPWEAANRGQRHSGPLTSERIGVDGFGFAAIGSAAAKSLQREAMGRSELTTNRQPDLRCHGNIRLHLQTRNQL